MTIKSGKDVPPMKLLELARPMELGDLAGLDTLKTDISGWYNFRFSKEDYENKLDVPGLLPSNAPQALLFHGPPGTGKTSAAYVIARTLLTEDEFDMNFIESNASDDRGIDFIRGEFKTAMRTKPFGDTTRKVILLDEADGLTPQAQDAMRQLIEKYSQNAMVILTCNQLEKIRPAIRSRCSIYAFKPVSPEAGAWRLVEILPDERSSSDETRELFVKLRKLVELMNGDLRACIMFLDSIDLADLESRVDFLEALTAADAADLATEGEWMRLRENLHALLDAGQSLPSVLDGFYRNIYAHFDGPALDHLWVVMAAYGDVMIHKHTWAGDDHSYIDYMVAKMKTEVENYE